MQEINLETVASPTAITAEPPAAREVVDKTVECRVALTGRRQQVLVSETQTERRVPDR